MARIEGFRVQNFRCLKDVTLGSFGRQPGAAPMTPFTAVIGKNGVGKSALLDAFGFLADCLKFGVEEACEKRGGFNWLHSQGGKSFISIEICYVPRDASDNYWIIYQLTIELDKHGRPVVSEEGLYTPDRKPYFVLEYAKGIIHSANKFKFSGDIEFTDPRKLALATIGSLKEHPQIAAFREFLESWYLSYFTPDAARGLPLAVPQRHLNLHGDNLANVVQYMEREHGERFQSILDRIAERIPGIDSIKTETTRDGRLLLCFNDKGFVDPFFAPQMSDGTLKLFAYMLLLEDPEPPPFICIEEPENGLYHKLLELLAAEFREHAMNGGSQVLLTTHQPYLVDAMDPEEVWVLEKGADGFSTITRASEFPYVKAMVEEGLPLGGLWYSSYLDSR